MANAQKSKEPEISVYYDHQRRTCLKVEEIDHLVVYIPLNVMGFCVMEMATSAFNQHYKPADYPVDKACQLYLNYCRTLGADKDVLDYLGRVITVTKEDYEVAAAKRRVAPKKTPIGNDKPVSEEKTTRKAAEKKPAPAAKPKTRAKAKPVATGSYRSAAQMFQALIMEGKLTDDEIFKEVQDAFDLDDKKRSYVKWYRNNLKKKGENPPDEKK